MKGATSFIVEILQETNNIFSMNRKKYVLYLTKSQLNKLYDLVKENKRSKTPSEVRKQLFSLYVDANNIIVNGGGA